MHGYSILAISISYAYNSIGYLIFHIFSFSFFFYEFYYYETKRKFSEFILLPVIVLILLVVAMFLVEDINGMSQVLMLVTRFVFLGAILLAKSIKIYLTLRKHFFHSNITITDDIDI